MANHFFQFKQFRINQDRCAMKVTTDACILGVATEIPQQGTLLDIGTGTGLLALMMAQRSGAIIEAVEVDPASCRQAGENFRESPWASRMAVICTSVESFMPGKSYDFIICNPPFYDRQLASPDKQRNLARHVAGLNFETLCAAVHRLLAEHGSFALLLPALSANHFSKKAEAAGLFPRRFLWISTRAGVKPYRCIVQYSFNPMIPESESLIVYNSPGVYTASFVKLLHPFYLQL